MSFRRKLSSAINRVKQDPGTEPTYKVQPLVVEVGTRRAALRALSDDEINHASRKMDVLDLNNSAQLVEFMSLASEVSRRALGLDPFDVQVLAALNMLQGRVVNMATGEGKTLVGYLVAAGRARAGDRVHVLSANDYLAKRDSQAGAPLFEAFGLSVSSVDESKSEDERREAYNRDVTYATVHQVGFDLLRDRQATSAGQRMVPALEAVVVDEIDAVLLDDAMVPLVLAGDLDAAETKDELTELISSMSLDIDYEIDPDNRSTSFLDPGFAKLEEFAQIDDIFQPEHSEYLGDAYTTLHAHYLLTRDVHYVVDGGRVKLVNEARGRIVDRQRWPDALHTAVENKEGVAATTQTEVLDQVLVQTVVKSYSSVTGMSGTATEAAERLLEDFEVRTGSIDTNLECIRLDEDDHLFTESQTRDHAAALRIQEAHVRHQPVLVGTPSVRDSERFAKHLTNLGMSPIVLNAKNDEDEAGIIAKAGRADAITISTQMAGRGVDIMLDDAAKDAGGLLVLSLGRYGSLRLDNQLRGRSGRQGDPGASVFYCSMDDAVVTENLDTDVDESQFDDAGEIIDPGLLEIYAHAQRRAEGKVLALHRKTRDFNVVLDNNRRSIVERRTELLNSDEALIDYVGQIESGNSTIDLSDATNLEISRQIVLFHFDQEWSRHLGYLSHVREGIHLRSLGREQPLMEFNKLAGQDFSKLPQRIREAVGESLASITDGTDVNDLQDLGLRRPSSTWTYMVAADPFGTPEDNITEFIANSARSGPAPIRYH